MNQVSTAVYGTALYTDGGTFKSNPGPMGSGVHGYLYNLSDKTVPDVSNSKFLYTAKGYIGKGNKEAGKLKSYKDIENSETILESDNKENLLVAPTHRVNFVISDKGYGTNNQAELIGMKNAMDFISHYNSLHDNQLKYAYVHCDSQYVVQGLNEYLPKWKRRGYKKSDGEEIGNKNEWVALENAYQEALNHCKVTVSWIKGHDGNLGNVHADNLASNAAVLNNSKMGKAVDYNEVLPIHESMISDADEKLPKGAKDNAAVEAEVTKGKKKKKTVSDSHPFLFAKRLIFNPQLANSDTGGFTRYFLLEPGNGHEDSFIGAEFSDASLIYLELKEKDPYISTVICNQLDWLNRYQCNTDIIVQGFLNKVLSKNIKDELDEKGDICIQGALDAVHNLFLADGTPITMVMSPAFLVHRNIQRLDSMSNWANLYKEGRAFGNSVDITTLFYSIEQDKKGNNKYTLLPNITNDLESIKTYALISDNYQKGAYDILTKETENSRLVTLTFGIDIPPRNVLKKIEKYEPSVYLYTIAKDNNLFEYFILIHLYATDEVLIMQSTYASDIIV